MRMMEQVLAPSMQHAQEADLGAQMGRVSGDGAERLGRGAEQDIVDDTLVLEGDDRDLLRHREDNMEILGVEEPEILGPADIRAYQIHLSQEKRLSASSILVAVAAIRFLYKVTLRRGWSVDEIIPTCRKPQKLPVVLSQDEVARFLDAVDSRKHRAILTICYAAGLRISEAVRLTPAAIDSQRMVICVEEGKGRKDRYVMLSPKLLGILRTYWQA